MFRTPASSPAALLIALLAALMAQSAATPRAQAQPNPAELRREVAVLKDQLRRTQEELEQLQAKYDELRRERNELATELARAKSQAQGGAPSGSNAPEPAAIPDDPYAGPESMLKALKAGFKSDLDGLERMTDAARVAAVKRWVRSAPRDMQGPFEWLVHVDEITKDDTGQTIAKARILDPTSRGTIGAPLDIPLDARSAKRIESDLATRPSWWFRGTMQAKPEFDQARVGPMDDLSPTLIGPHAVFGYRVNVTRVTPWRPPAP